MLATSNFPFAAANPFAPPASSPLAPISANARLPRQAMADDFKSRTPYSKRQIKSNPLLRPRDQNIERRRNAYLKQMQERRSDRNWATRGEQILRSDYVSERKQWESQQAKSAPMLDEPLEEDEAELPTFSSQGQIFQSQTMLDVTQPSSDDAREADEARQQEEEELEALVALMEAEESPERTTRNQGEDSQRFGSDEDYDDIFLNLLESGDQSMLSQRNPNESDTMDTSHG
ncbi:MAG: hypothetical protein M1820_004902 [Bogoriella megaspora]|nr:MAG: hypothetical protein M1820_004902 [Bogoriella megaspora]